MNDFIVDAMVHFDKRERERKAVYLTVAQSVQKCLVKCTVAPKEAYKTLFKTLVTLVILNKNFWSQNSTSWRDCCTNIIIESLVTKHRVLLEIENKVHINMKLFKNVIVIISTFVQSSSWVNKVAKILRAR